MGRRRGRRRAAPATPSARARCGGAASVWRRHHATSSRPLLVSLVRAVSRDGGVRHVSPVDPARAGPGGPGGGGGARGAALAERLFALRRYTGRRRVAPRAAAAECAIASDLHALLDTRGDALGRVATPALVAAARGFARAALRRRFGNAGCVAAPALIRRTAAALASFASGRLRTRTRNRDGRTRNGWRPGGPPRRVRARRVRASRLALRDGARVAAPRRERAAAAVDRGDGRAAGVPAAGDARRRGRGARRRARRGAQRRGG